MVAIHISNESDFAVDVHQFILTAPEYSLPCQPSKLGDMEMRYDGAVIITNFNVMYYYESGLLLPRYTNFSPYDHPLDRQGHITLASHSGVATYSSYIRLVTTGIPVTIMTDGQETQHYYTDLVGMVPNSFKQYLGESTLSSSSFECLHFQVRFRHFLVTFD